MFYIDEILYPDILSNFLQKTSTSTTATIASTRPSVYSTVVDVEQVPSEITESSDGDDGRDVLLQDGDIENIDEVAIPRALPLLYVNTPK